MYVSLDCVACEGTHDFMQLP